MQPRSPRESHRVATPLELFFDLVFVVAVAQAASALHHAIAEAHAFEGLIGYAMAFFAIWWAWMNFTWFASAYDCDDVPYRATVFVQLAGALILAAGIGGMAERPDPSAAVLVGYVVMRVAMVAQWLRASLADPPRRVTARRYATGISLIQIVWIGLFFLLPAWWLPGFVVLCVVEMAIPVWAERAGQTPWHPHHIAERYGLLTLIVLGGSILAASLAVQSALTSEQAVVTLAPIVGGGLLTVCAMWWIYFDRPSHHLLTSFATAFLWGYGHYLIFAASAAVGAGLAVYVDVAFGRAKVGMTAAGIAVAVPVALFLLCLWVLHDRRKAGANRMVGPLAALVVLLTPLTHLAVPLIGATLAALVAAKISLRTLEPSRAINPRAVNY